MRKLIKKLHLYAALILCLPLIIQGLSGATLVFQHELSAKKYVLAEGEKKPLSEIISAAKVQMEDGFKLNSIRFDEAATLRFSKRDEGRPMMKEVVIDPVSLQVLEIKDSQNDIFRLIKKFHASLLIEGETGKNIVAVYGFVLLFMTISGIILWWPKAGNLKRALTFKWSSEGKKFHRDIHAAFGFWFSILLLITSFSGIYLVYPKGTSAFIASIFPARDLRETPKANPSDNEPITIDEALALSGEENLVSVMIPGKPDQPYRFNFAPQNYRTGQPQVIVFVDQYEKRILEIRDPQKYSLGETITIWLHSLHEGQGLGLVYQIAIFCVGFLPLLFSITGITLWYLKRKSKKLSAV